MKRVFVAILSSAEIKKHVEDWRGEHNNLPARWVPAENLHITVIPPWVEEDIEAVADKLDEIHNKFAPFEIKFQKISCGPSPRQPRLIWATGRADENLVKLQKDIVQLLGKEPIDRIINPHLTLARLRPGDRFYFAQKELNETIDWKEKAEAVCLVESILKPEGAEYKILKKVSLQ